MELNSLFKACLVAIGGRPAVVKDGDRLFNSENKRSLDGVAFGYNTFIPLLSLFYDSTMPV